MYRDPWYSSGFLLLLPFSVHVWWGQQSLIRSTQQCLIRGIMQCLIYCRVCVLGHAKKPHILDTAIPPIVLRPLDQAFLGTT